MTDRPTLTETEAERLYVYEFDCDWFVAASEAEARTLFHQHHVIDTRAIDDDECARHLAEGVRQLPDDEPFGIHCDEKGNITDWGTVIHKRAGQWAREEGKGFLCSTER